MKMNYVENIFLNSIPNIRNNDNLRVPQKAAHASIYEHFMKRKNEEDALIVVPTGVGKTGIIALAPYFVSSGRVLIIAPSLSIKNELMSNLDPNNNENFLLKFGVFTKATQLPTLIEYSSDIREESLRDANLVVINIQKLQERLDSSLIHRVDSDFFDLIIIDEAHHSSAKTWTETLNYFDQAKVVKVTGTPFRSDGVKVKGELIYHYPLSRAMHNELIKSLENIVHVPGEIKLTIDEQDKEYTVEEIYSLGIKDSDWVTRSVAYSEDCSRSIVNRSMNILKEKKEVSNLPHKIIAVACSISHAEQIKRLYEEVGLRVSLVHSNLPETKLDNEFNKIESHLVDVVVHVAMLGEGYDHSYLSVAAIFRPFRHELPYIQFIGRILRYINNERATDIDNIGHIVVHENLELDNLWEKYKEEINKSTIIKELATDDNIIRIDFGNYSGEESYDLEYGDASEDGVSTIRRDVFARTELLKRAEDLSDDFDKKLIQKIMSDFNQTEENAKIIARQMSATAEDLRPDLTFKNTQEGFNSYIHEEVIPDVLTHFNVNPKDDELKELPIFKSRISGNWYGYITNKVNYNSAYLGFFFNAFLKNKMGRARDKWESVEDFNIGYDILKEIVDYIKKLEI